MRRERGGAVHVSGPGGMRRRRAQGRRHGDGRKCELGLGALRRVRQSRVNASVATCFHVKAAYIEDEHLGWYAAHATVLCVHGQRQWAVSCDHMVSALGERGCVSHASVLSRIGAMPGGGNISLHFTSLHILVLVYARILLHSPA